MTRRLLVLLALLVGLSVPAHAQVSITYTFTNGTTADADQVNTNFSVLGSQALNRTGGTITGNISVNNGVTIDGVDISAVMGGTGTPTFSTLTITSASASAIDVTGGINAGSGNVGIVDTSGRIPSISSTFFASLSGANLTALNASNVASGTLATANGGLGVNAAAVPQGSVIFFSGTGSVASLAPGATGSYLRTNGASANVSWSTDGAAFTALNATALASGTVPDARVAGAYTSALTLSNGANVFTASYKSSDGTAGVTTTCSSTPTGAWMTVKNGLITAIVC